MKVAFACPACAAPATADAALVGREALCRHCKARFIVPGPGEAELDVYAIDDSIGQADGNPSSGAEPASTFVPSQGDDQTTFVQPRRTRRATPVSRSRGSERSEPAFPWRTALVWVGVVLTVVLAFVALVVPGGPLMVAGILMGVGSLLVLVGFGAGGYGAFREDFLYGFLYLVIPLYTAYYVATRWEDLWPWFACSTAGVGLVLLGTELLRWSGSLG